MPVTDPVPSPFRPEAVRRHAAGGPTGATLRDVPARLLVQLWICAGVLGAGLLGVVAWLHALLG